ncbi:MAG: hypothetical protein Q8O01_05585 [Candidatus Omnitrophota bacterium]|nr:hypothetical protein [Candidatus Omnitrophota bacterium]
MNRPSLMTKAVSIFLVSTFFVSQGYAQAFDLSTDKLSPSLVTDPKINAPRSAAVQNDIVEKAEPGAIGNGIPLMELAQGKLPARIKWNSELEREHGDVVRDTLKLAMVLSESAISEGRIPPQHLNRVKYTISNLIGLQGFLTQIGYLFNADIRDKENYLVGFNFQDHAGYSIELIHRFYDISPKRLAQYIFHECVPEKGMVTERDDHRVIYNEIQAAIFGRDEVLALKKDLREFIDERAGKQNTPDTRLKEMVSAQTENLLSHITVTDTEAEMGKVAAEAILKDIRDAIQKRGKAVMLLASAPSQHSTWKALIELWDNLPAEERRDLADNIIAFHMDEYLGLESGAEQLFGIVLRERVFAKLGIKAENTYYLNDRLAYETAVALRKAIDEGRSEDAKRLSAQLEKEAQAHADQITEEFMRHGGVFDIVIGGIGIAFNDPPEAKFNDPKTVKVVRITETSRQQQVDDKEFKKISDVPTHALTFSLTPILSARRVHIIIPRAFKAESVRRTLDLPISEENPASGLRLPNVLPNVRIYLDKAAASLSSVARMAGERTPITEKLARREVEEYAQSSSGIINTVTGVPDKGITTVMCLYLTGKLPLRNPSDPSMGAVELIVACDDRISYLQATSALISMKIKVQFGLTSMQREALESFLLSDRTDNNLTDFSDLAIAKSGKRNDADYAAKVRNAFQIARNELLATQGAVVKVTPGYLPRTVFGHLQRNQGIGRALRIIAELNEQGFSLTDSHAALLADYFIGIKSLSYVISNMNMPDDQKKLIIVSKIVAMKIAGFNNLNDEQRYTIELFLREHNDPYYFVRLGKTQRDFDALILQASEKAKASKPATQDEYWKLFFSNLGIDTNESPWQRAVQSLCENPNNSLWVKEMFDKVLSAASMEMRDGMRGKETSRGSPAARGNFATDKMPEKNIPTSAILVAQVSEDLPVRAEKFKFNLTKILAENPDQIFFIGIETDIGESQKSQIMPIYRAIDEIKDLKDADGKDLFPNLIVRRAKAKDLVSTANDLNKMGKLEFKNAFIGARRVSVDSKIYDSIKGEGRAWISAIDDLNAGDYLPVFEAITLNMMAYLNADVTAIKNFYDAISDRPIDPAALQEMIRNRIIYILPKAAKFDAKQLRALYELARQVYTAA